MFVLYILFASLILIKMIDRLPSVIRLIFSCAFQPTAAIGGFLGASIFESIRHGVYKGIFITESGIGTSAIPHALADVEKPTDQALLAMYSVAADTLLCLISGLLVLVTGSWWQKNISNVVVYQAFKNHAPHLGQIVLLISIALFVFTTTIGNAFNGSQSLATLTKHRYLKIYAILASLATAIGAMLDLPIIWNICDILLALVAIPNCLGVLLIYLKTPKDFELK
jgi:AGCS family alanine or glycine:cation symporter